MDKRKDIISSDPIERLLSLREDFDNMFRDFFTGFGASQMSRKIFPLMDVKEDSKKYIIEVEVPGVEKEDLKLSIKKDKLIIRGEKREEKKKEGESFLRVERSYGGFRRVESLPTEVDKSRVEAKYENGVLRIYLPKIAEEKPKEMEVKVD
ncbi:MAG: Hsp20/alpha crystallin family protein [candidate division WOR-3 bacterium]|nr:Hsp20/alpha crystallin family protein [candidate division WOR-3 bacterium]